MAGLCSLFNQERTALARDGLWRSAKGGYLGDLPGAPRREGKQRRHLHNAGPGRLRDTQGRVRVRVRVWCSIEQALRTARETQSERFLQMENRRPEKAKNKYVASQGNS